MSASEQPSRRRVYLDHAATSWPKCGAALEAAATFMRDCGATTGRGAYSSALDADRWLGRARRNLAQLIGADGGQTIAMCSSGTHALNAGLWGLLRSGDHVITTAMEHNSLLRPLQAMKQTFGIDFSVVAADRAGRVDALQAEKYLRAETKLLAVGHASNVTGAVNDLRPWSEVARRHGIALLVDVSQTVGYLPIDVNELGEVAVAAAGHKGLRGLPGTGFLYLAPSLQADFRPLLLGGTGRSSESIDATPEWPQSVEVGNLNMPGVISMAVAAEELQAESGWLDGWAPTFAKLVTGLATIPQVTLVGGLSYDPIGQSVPVVSVQVDGWDVHDLAAVLDTSFGIEARAGWHCAALVHNPVGTQTTGGTLRLSTGRSTTDEEIDYTLQAFREILGEGRV